MPRNFKKLNNSHHCKVSKKPRIVYNSAFSSKQLFDKKVVNSLIKLHAKKKPLYSDVLTQSIPQKSVKCEKRLSCAPKKSAKVLPVLGTESRMKVNKSIVTDSAPKRRQMKAKVYEKVEIQTKNRFQVFQNDIENVAESDSDNVSADPVEERVRERNIRQSGKSALKV